MELRRVFLSLAVVTLAVLPGLGQSGTWSVTGSMAHARSGQGTALLQNGKVLTVGGWNLGVVDASAEVFNPATGTWSATGSVNLARYGGPAVTLPNGKVLFAGGCINNCNDITSSAELYDPATGTWSSTGFLGTPRYFYTAVLLKTGKVLVAGGCNAPACATVTASCMIPAQEVGLRPAHSVSPATTKLQLCWQMETCSSQVVLELLEPWLKRRSTIRPLVDGPPVGT